LLAYPYFQLRKFYSFFDTLGNMVEKAKNGDEK